MAAAIATRVCRPEAARGGRIMTARVCAAAAMAEPTAASACRGCHRRRGVATYGAAHENPATNTPRTPRRTTIMPTLTARIPIILPAVAPGLLIRRNRGFSKCTQLTLGLLVKEMGLEGSKSASETVLQPAAVRRISMKNDPVSFRDEVHKLFTLDEQCRGTYMTVWIRCLRRGVRYRNYA